MGQTESHSAPRALVCPLYVLYRIDRNRDEYQLDAIYSNFYDALAYVERRLGADPFDVARNARMRMDEIHQAGPYEFNPYAAHWNVYSNRFAEWCDGQCRGRPGPGAMKRLECGDQFVVLNPEGTALLGVYDREADADRQAGTKHRVPVHREK